MLNDKKASSSSYGELTGDVSFESSPVEASAMSRQTSATSFETADSFFSHAYSDCDFAQSFPAEEHTYGHAFLTSSPLRAGQDDEIDSWISHMPTVNPVDVMSVQPSDSFAPPYFDFELFPGNAHASEEPSLFAIPTPTIQVVDSTTVEHAAPLMASRSLYVDKATSTSGDVPETSPTLKTPSAAKKHNRPIHSSPRPSQPTTPKKVSKRHACRMPSCDKSFVRRSDVLRHQADVHGLAAEFYQCEASESCSYHTRRSDKMKEHCQKMHGHRKGSETFAVVQQRR